jgi:hypothetical protein
MGTILLITFLKWATIATIVVAVSLFIREAIKGKWF